MNITILHSDQRHGAMDIAERYDMDKGVLALTGHIAIGQMTWDNNHKITCYAEQVDEYRIWLEDCIKAQVPGVLGALEDIFQKAQTGGIILTTRCCPAPYVTHAHVVLETIKKLAGET